MNNQNLNQIITETEIKTEPVNWDNFEAGKYLNWNDGERHKVTLTNWVMYKKAFVDQNSKQQVERWCLRIDVIGSNGVPCKKVIDTSSFKLIQAIKPFLMAADSAGIKVLVLDIARKGLMKDTTYFVERLSMP